MENTLITPVIRPDLVDRYLETLYRHTVPNFYCYLIDQTPRGLNTELLRNKYKNLMIIRTPKTQVHTTGNLGFSKATNLGISLVETPYFTMCNDDVEFINRQWWGGVLDTFKKVDEATPERPCLTVTPASIKLPDWSVGRPSGDDFYIMPYKTKYSQEDYDKLVNEPHYINEHLTLQPGAVIDGVTLYCSVFKTRPFLEVGLLDEKYYPGGAEDYDYCCRAYMHGYRCVGTTLSWIFHHWSKSLNPEDEDVKALVQDNLRFGDHNITWGKDEEGENFHDTWGVKCRECNEVMLIDKANPAQAICSNNHRPFKMPESTIMPL